MSDEDFSILLSRVSFVVEDFREWVSEDGACLIETDSMLLEVSLRFVVIPFEFHTHYDSFRVSMNPQGKPAGLQSISNVRDSADVALLTPGGWDGFPS
jgi:hypothetical protein